MKKKLAALLCSLLLAVCCCIPAVAATKPAIELMAFIMETDSVGGVSPTLYYRNNTNKTMKYLDFYITAYNRVGDKVEDWITGDATKKFRIIGPVEPFQLVREQTGTLRANNSIRTDSPFYYYATTKYWIESNGSVQNVYQDVHGNFFVKPNLHDESKNIYLTEDEINNAMFYDYCACNTGWYSTTISYLNVDKVVVTYMDGTTQTVKNVGSAYRKAPRQNLPFMQQVEQYRDVYNYHYYLSNNPDLGMALGNDQKKLFEHFITTGMKEGRQASKDFNLETYKANNPDLVAAFGSDNAKYYEHYISTGKAEGRIAA